MHDFKVSVLSAAGLEGVLFTMLRVAGTVSGACCTNDGRVTLLMALAGKSFSFSFSESSRNFALSARGVSVVRKKRNRCVRDRKTGCSDCSVVYSGFPVGDHPAAPAY